MKGFRIYLTYYYLNVARNLRALAFWIGITRNWFTHEHEPVFAFWNCWIRIIEGISKKEYKLDPALEFASQRVLRWNVWLTVCSVMLSLWYRVIEFYPFLSLESSSSYWPFDHLSTLLSWCDWAGWSNLLRTVRAWSLCLRAASRVLRSFQVVGFHLSLSIFLSQEVTLFFWGGFVLDWATLIRRAVLQCQLVYAIELDWHLNRRIGELLEPQVLVLDALSKVSFCRSQWHTRNICCIVFFFIFRFCVPVLGDLAVPSARIDIFAAGAPCEAYSRIGLQQGACDVRAKVCKMDSCLQSVIACAFDWMLQTSKVKVLTPDSENAFFFCQRSQVVERIRKWRPVISFWSKFQVWQMMKHSSRKSSPCHSFGRILSTRTACHLLDTNLLVMVSEKNHRWRLWPRCTYPCWEPHQEMMTFLGGDFRLAARKIKDFSKVKFDRCVFLDMRFSKVKAVKKV